MKKLLLTLGLIGCTLASALAQGTITWPRGVSARVYVEEIGGARRNATAADGIKVGVFYGPAGSTPDQFVMAPWIATIGSSPGVMINTPGVLALPGTEPFQVVSLQFRGWNDLGGYGETEVKRVTLGPTAGPGTIVWDPGEIGPNPWLVVKMVPEPSTIAIGIIGAVFALFRTRKSIKAK